MFNKDLFLSLCGKYNVELSDTLARPMMKVGSQLCDITNSDVSRVFAPKQTYFAYSDNIICPVSSSSVYCLQEENAIAC